MEQEGRREAAQQYQMDSNIGQHTPCHFILAQYATNANSKPFEKNFALNAAMSKQESSTKIL